MFPGTSPVLLDENGTPTNTRPPGNDRRWKFAQYVGSDIDQPQVVDANTQQGNSWLETWRFRA